MKSRTNLLNQRVAGWLGALVVFLVGLSLLHSNGPPGSVLRFASYDWLYDLSLFQSSNSAPGDLVIIYLDEASHRDLGQPLNRPWDRALHARLLDRLTRDGARAVVFDIVFSDPGLDPPADQALAEAIRRNGKVILAADYPFSRPVHDERASFGAQMLTLPYEPFAQVAAHWGLAQLLVDRDFVVREHAHAWPDVPHVSLSWAAALQLKLPATAPPRSRLKERWVNYYSGPDYIPSVSYMKALEEPPGSFHDKIVFIGARPMTAFPGERRDEFRSPHTSWFREPVFIPAVEIHATLLLNLMRQEWLWRLPPMAEWMLLLFAAVGCGYGLTQLRPTFAVSAALGGWITFTLGAVLLFDFGRGWFPWMIIVAAQIPASLLWSFTFRSLEWYVTRRTFEQERRQADSRIREQAALLDKAQDAIMVHDLAWRTTYWNPSAERLYGWSAEEAAQRHVGEMLCQSDRESFAAARHAVLTNGEWAGQLRQTTKSGHEILVESHWTRVCDETGAPKSILVINTDVTEKKQLESQLLRAQRMESIGTLAGGIAHDLNNVLSPILMAVQFVQAEERDERKVKLLKTMELSAQRGADMVKQVLAFARGQEGEKVLIQLKHIIREMDKIIRETFPKSIDVKTHLATDLQPIKGDATQLHQVLLNLCVNARDALPEGGSILISAKNALLNEAAAKRILGARPGNYVSLQVTDTGSGIPPEVLDRIFEPFFTTKKLGEGTGLGLSTVLSIVKSHGGFIDVASEIGKGTTFTILFPPAEPLPAQAPAPVARAAVTGEGKLVLVVDDEAPIRLIIEEILVSHHYRVLLAENGALGVALFQRHADQIGAVVIDTMMPVMDGNKAMQIMREIRPDVSFIVISGLTEHEKAIPIPEGPRITVLRKPFPPVALLDTLQRLSGADS